MSIEEAKSFLEGLKDLSAENRADLRATTETFIAQLEGASKEITDACHVYAKSMTERFDQYLTDIQELYKSIYDEQEMG